MSTYYHIVFKVCGRMPIKVLVGQAGTVSTLTEEWCALATIENVSPCDLKVFRKVLKYSHQA